MSETDPLNPSWPIVHLHLRLASFLAAIGAIFVLYLWLIYPVDVASRSGIILHISALLALFGALIMVSSWLRLRPLRALLWKKSRREEIDPELARLADARAARLPRWGAVVTSIGWLLGGLLLRPTLIDAGLPRDAAVAGMFAGGCTGALSALLFYYLASSELYEVRLQIPCERRPVRGSPISVRVLVTSVAILLVGVAFVGVSAYLDHQVALERSAVSSCERVLKALVSVEAPSQQIVEAAAQACEGSAEVAVGGRVLASLGAEGIRELPAGRGPKGTLLSMPLRSGATLYALVRSGGKREGGFSFAGELAAFGCIAMMLAVGVALAASRAITAPVRGLAEGAEAMARGDLTREVPVLTGDEIGSLASSFSKMSSGLRSMVQNVHDAAETLTGQVNVVATAGTLVRHGLEARHSGVAQATAEMTQMDQSVAQVGHDVAGLSEFVASTGAALSQFAAALDEVRRHGAELDRSVAAARLEVHELLKAAEATRNEIAQLAGASRSTLATVAESGRTLRALAEAAHESERVSQRLYEETAAGSQVVEEGVRGVEAIRGVVAEARAHVEALGKRSSDITAVVDFIAEVAGRTNLLSLNAAIIAAQAGEQGKPFGVVADQIRELAAQIGSSTKRIGDIIAGVGLEVEATRGAIQHSDELAVQGVERAREGGAALARIAEQAKHGRTIAQTIAPAVSAHAESNHQIEQLAARVVDMAQGFAGVELLVRGSKSIEAMAQSLSPLTARVGRALEEQAQLSRKQVESVEEINRMIARLDSTVERHGEGTAQVLKNLSELMELAKEDRRAVDELASAAQALTRHAAVLRAGLEQLRT